MAPSLGMWSAECEVQSAIMPNKPSLQSFTISTPSTTAAVQWPLLHQTPVFLVRTFREHCQEMHNLLRMSWPRTLQGNSEFTGQFTDNILSGTHAQYIQNVPGHVTAVFQLGKLWENSGFVERCSCSVPKWLIERTLPVHCKFPDYVTAMYPLGKLWENPEISQRRYPLFSELGHWECMDNVPNM